VYEKDAYEMVQVCLTVCPSETTDVYKIWSRGLYQQLSGVKILVNYIGSFVYM
jgi:hypothetical protein